MQHSTFEKMEALQAPRSVEEEGRRCVRGRAEAPCSPREAHGGLGCLSPDPEQISPHSHEGAQGAADPQQELQPVESSLCRCS